MSCRLVMLALLALTGGGGIACDRVLGDRLDVSLRPSGGLKSGDGVYFSGIRIGTAGTPRFRDGKAIVPVYVRSMDVLPKDGMIFLLADDARERRKCLSIIALRGARPSGEPPLYQGAANGLELAALVGSAEAKRLLQGLAEWLPPVTR